MSALGGGLSGAAGELEKYTPSFSLLIFRDN